MLFATDVENGENLLSHAFGKGMGSRPPIAKCKKGVLSSSIHKFLPVRFEEQEITTRDNYNYVCT